MTAKQRVATKSSDKATAPEPAPEARAERLDRAFAEFEKQKYDWIERLADQRREPNRLVD